MKHTRTRRISLIAVAMVLVLTMTARSLADAFQQWLDDQVAQIQRNVEHAIRDWWDDLIEGIKPKAIDWWEGLKDGLADAIDDFREALFPPALKDATDEQILQALAQAIESAVLDEGAGQQLLVQATESFVRLDQTWVVTDQPVTHTFQYIRIDFDAGYLVEHLDPRALAKFRTRLLTEPGTGLVGDLSGQAVGGLIKRGFALWGTADADQQAQRYFDTVERHCRPAHDFARPAAGLSQAPARYLSPVPTAGPRRSAPARASARAAAGRYEPATCHAAYEIM